MLPKRGGGSPKGKVNAKKRKESSDLTPPEMRLPARPVFAHPLPCARSTCGALRRSPSLPLCRANPILLAHSARPCIHGCLTHPQSIIAVVAVPATQCIAICDYCMTDFSPLPLQLLFMQLPPPPQAVPPAATTTARYIVDTNITWWTEMARDCSWDFWECQGVLQ